MVARDEGSNAFQGIFASRSKVRRGRRYLYDTWRSQHVAEIDDSGYVAVRVEQDIFTICIIVNHLMRKRCECRLDAFSENVQDGFDVTSNVGIVYVDKQASKLPRSLRVPKQRTCIPLVREILKCHIQVGEPATESRCDMRSHLNVIQQSSL